MEPDPNMEYEYMVLKPGSSQVSIGLRNYSCHKVMVPAKSIIAANVVPHFLAPNLDNETTLKQFEKCWEQLQTQEDVGQFTNPEVPE